MIEVLEDYFESAPPDVVAAYLFGSVARSDATPASDIDVAVIFDPPPPSVLGSMRDRIEDDLERRFGVQVDVVVANTAPADLFHRVLRDGVVVLDRDRARRIRFEVDRRNEFFDLLPIIERYRAGVDAA